MGLFFTDFHAHTGKFMTGNSDSCHFEHHLFKQLRGWETYGMTKLPTHFTFVTNGCGLSVCKLTMNLAYIVGVDTPLLPDHCALCPRMIMTKQSWYVNSMHILVPHSKTVYRTTTISEFAAVYCLAMKILGYSRKPYCISIFLVCTWDRQWN